MTECCYGLLDIEILRVLLFYCLLTDEAKQQQPLSNGDIQHGKLMSSLSIRLYTHRVV